ncbi:hypothetical protein DPMN_068960 [Dreissena polymorpha]|uniref:Uncharacterized protein n=1 Tax=Dreissena polymorpha TaxID=45954 RepID=A0A9D3Z377_DREPO|nr:hypothetical protein DPMN_068960 [Dreissena polymorpha]
MLAIDCFTKTSTDKKRNGIQWTHQTVGTHPTTDAGKGNMVVENLARLGLTINRQKSRVLKTNASNDTSITVQSEALQTGERLHLSQQHSGQLSRNGCRCQNPNL